MAQKELNMFENSLCKDYLEYCNQSEFNFCSQKAELLLLFFCIFWSIRNTSPVKANLAALTNA